MLDPETERLWQGYLAAEQAHVGRQETILPVLERFIDGLLLEKPGAWQVWALELARRMAEDGEEIPVRMPLFRRVLLPVLAEGVKTERPDCARYLAHFSCYLSRSRTEAEAAGLPEHLLDERGLVREALRVDPGDTKARERLKAHLGAPLLGAFFDSWVGLHTLEPVDSDRRREILEALIEAKGELELSEDASVFRELLEDCERHIETWRERIASPHADRVYLTFEWITNPNN